MMFTVLLAAIWLSGGVVLWRRVNSIDGIAMANLAVAAYNVVAAMALVIVFIIVQVAGR